MREIYKVYIDGVFMFTTLVRNKEITKLNLHYMWEASPVDFSRVEGDMNNNLQSWSLKYPECDDEIDRVVTFALYREDDIQLDMDGIINRVSDSLENTPYKWSMCGDVKMITNDSIKLHRNAKLTANIDIKIDDSDNINLIINNSSLVSIERDSGTHKKCMEVFHMIYTNTLTRYNIY